MSTEIRSVKWEYEDRLPNDIPRHQFDEMFDSSRLVDGVRMYPYTEVDEGDCGVTIFRRIYLTDLVSFIYDGAR